MTECQIHKAAHLWLRGQNSSEISIALFVFESDVERWIEDIKAEARLIAARAA